MACVRAVFALKLRTYRFTGCIPPRQNPLTRTGRNCLHRGAQNYISDPAILPCRAAATLWMLRVKVEAAILVSHWFSSLSDVFRNLIIHEGYHDSRSLSSLSCLQDQWPSLRRWRVQVRAASQMSAESSQAIFYSDIGADRASENRRDAIWLAEAFSRKDSQIIVLADNQSLVKGGRRVFLSRSSLQAPDDDMDPIFLGISESSGVPIFAVDLKRLLSTDAIQRELEDGAQWVDLRKYGPQLEASEAGILAYARGMVEWHFRNRFCGHCGSKVVSQEGGHCLKCTSGQCGKLSYPRMDPAVIMLITLGNYVLLGRQAKWEPGRYSVLAGFLEIGESFEKAVAREVKEETGVTIDESSLRYVGSQPWPFPSTVMVGFTGTARRRHVEHLGHGHGSTVQLPEGDEVKSLPPLRADGSELEDARWVHKSFLRSVILGNASPQGQRFSLPGKYSIAGTLLRTWAAEDNSEPRLVRGDVPTVDIDEGIFKYILVRVEDSDGNQKMVVRGAKTFAYHSDILDATRRAFAPLGLQVEQFGGGKIEHQAANRLLRVFSSSQAYGQADHELTKALLRQSFPLYSISLS